MSALPRISEQTAAPGTALNGYARTITADDIATYVARTGESIDDYTMGGRLMVPAGMLMGLYGPLIHGTFQYEAGVHVSSEMELHRAPAADEPLQIEGRVLGLSERNGNKYVTFSVEVNGREGERLATVNHTSIYELRAKAD